MRTISGARNRLALALAGLLSLVLSALLLSRLLDLATLWPAADQVLPESGARIGDLLSTAGVIAPVVGAIVSVVAVLIGLVLLLSQVPSRPSAPRLRITGQDGTLLASLDPDVLERSLQDRVLEQSGVTAADVRLSGAASAPWLQVDLTVSDRAETSWAVEAARTRLVSDLRLALGVEPRRVDILVSLGSSTAGAKEARIPAASSADRPQRTERILA